MEKKRIEPNDDGSTTVPLRTPIKKKSGGTIEEITIPAKIFVSQMEAMDEYKGENAKMRALIAEVGNVSVRDLAKLDAADFVRLSTEVGLRLDGGSDDEEDEGGKESPPTGET